MNRKVIGVVLGVMLFFLILSLGGAVYLHHLRISNVVVAAPEVIITSPPRSFSALTPEDTADTKKKFDEMFADDMDPRVQALPASAAKH